MSLFNVTVPCHCSMPPFHATVPCHRSMEQFHATVQCHRSMSLFHAIVQSHCSMHPFNATVPCHCSMPPFHATFPCHCSMSPFHASYGSSYGSFARHKVLVLVVGANYFGVNYYFFRKLIKFGTKGQLFDVFGSFLRASYCPGVP